LDPAQQQQQPRSVSFERKSDADDSSHHCTRSNDERGEISCGVATPAEKDRVNDPWQHGSFLLSPKSEEHAKTGSNYLGMFIIDSRDGGRNDTACRQASL